MTSDPCPALDGVFFIHVPSAATGKRLDELIVDFITDISRSQVTRLIKGGYVTINSLPAVKAGQRVRSGEVISIDRPAPAPASQSPENIPIERLYEDASIVVLHKPAGLVVHPAPGHADGTLVNALLYHCPDLSGIGGQIRPGIVHRLDQDTSGVMVVAKNEKAHLELSRQFKERMIEKHYDALVYGEPKQETGEMDQAIGRHPVDRKRMSVRSRHGRAAITRWRVRERFGGAAWLEINLLTGRTHQIRVHCEAMQHPIVGDPVYNKGRRQVPAAVLAILAAARRQMLHASTLAFDHPESRQRLCFRAPPPADMMELLARLRAREKSG